MIDIKALDNDEPLFGGLSFANYYKNALMARGESADLVDTAKALNQKRRTLVHEIETLKAQQNKVGAEIAQKKKSKEDASQLLAEMQEVSAKGKALSTDLDTLELELHDFMLRLPNVLHADVPAGKGEGENKEVKRVGEPKSMAFSPKEHWEIGERLDILDFERGTKVAGARFTFLKGAAARMEMALIQFMLDTHIEENGYEMIIPPFAVNSQSLTGTGQFPKFKDDVFHLEGTDYHMIPTAEVPVTNLYAGEILAEKDLPQQLVAYSPCFRSEAGSYGKDTKGLIRQHQFNKVELVMFSHPDKSYEMHEKMLSDAEKILNKLELPYRVVTLCSGDIGFGAAKTYDIEVWLPGQNQYREISSCSNCEDFQARRANMRFRPEGPKAKPLFLHTLNGSGLAVGRTLIAILENYQLADGRVEVPQVLQQYMGHTKVLGPK
ncbi:MAG: serine--tRNA ligase [Bdellovibrionales bacterium]|nr:serine--tRNA ligase [Bdellovibrionales bacterium]